MTVDVLKDYQDPGTPPGTLRAAEGETAPTRIRWVRYSPTEIEAREISSVEPLKNLERDGRFHWIHVIGLGEPDILCGIGECFGLHALALEDVVNLGQRPKAEDYEDQLFAVLQHLSLEEAEVHKRQVSVFLGPHYVVTFQPTGPDLLSSIGKRLQQAQGRIRQRGPGYLAYAIIDLIVDSAFPTLEATGERLEEIEDLILEGPDRGDAGRLQGARREILKLRQVLWPQREVLAKLTREDHHLISSDARLYLRDCYDHAVQALEVSETYREMASGMMDIYLSSLSHKLNDVIRVLTIISTIFMPLAFLTGIYGMNFDTSKGWNMPELQWKFGYAGFWGTALLMTAGMLYYFRRKGWL